MWLVMQVFQGYLILMAERPAYMLFNIYSMIYVTWCVSCLADGHSIFLSALANLRLHSLLSRDEQIR